MTENRISSLIDLGDTHLKLGKFDEAVKCFIQASSDEKLLECAREYADALTTKKYYVYYGHIRGRKTLRKMLAVCLENGDAKTAKVIQTQIRKYDI